MKSQKKALKRMKRLAAFKSKQKQKKVENGLSLILKMTEQALYKDLSTVVDQEDKDNTSY